MTFCTFATHGVIDNRWPALSGLALAGANDGTPIDEGFLRLHTITELPFMNDLVVLSACDSASGLRLEGEGFQGLTHGFLSAGAKNVVASLWKVPDRASKELMVRFYRNLRENDASPAEALRQAQLEMRAMRRWMNPVNWAGFVLHHA